MTVAVEHVWKRYRSWERRERTLRGIVAGRVPALDRRGGRWALEDVSMEIGPGGSMGVIGGNGAGKSTLLRLVAGIGTPTRGQVRTPDDTAAVLTLGDTLDPDLTGAENAVTAAIVAGFGRREARARLSDIVGFAELEHAIDAPVRTYSEGMKLRLAFGVVAQLTPAALVVDEALAVGDGRFQERCLERVGEMRGRGAALLLASHDLDLVGRTCERATWLDAGAVRATGPAGEVIAEYRGAMMSATLDRTPPPRPGDPEELELRRNRFGSQEVAIDDVAVSGETASDGTTELPAGAPLTVAFTVSCRQGAVPVNLAVSVLRVRDGLKCCDALGELPAERLAGGPARVEVSYPRLELAADEYRVELGAYEADWAYAYDLHTAAYRLRLTGPPSGGVYAPEPSWRITPPGGNGERS